MAATWLLWNGCRATTLPSVLCSVSWANKRAVVDMVDGIERRMRESEPAYGFDHRALDGVLAAEGFRICRSDDYRFSELRPIDADVVGRWLRPPAAGGVPGESATSGEAAASGGGGALGNTDGASGSAAAAHGRRHMFAEAAAALLSASEIDALRNALVRRLCAADAIGWPIHYTVWVAQKT